MNSRFKNMDSQNQNKYDCPYNPEKSKVQSYISRGRTYSDIKGNDRNTL